MKRRVGRFFRPYGYTTLEDVLFIFGWGILDFLCLVGVLDFVAPEFMRRISLPCAVYFLTGHYCPGCGGTRALKALFRGDIVLSVMYHPMVLYMAVLGGIFMVSQTLFRITGGKVRGLRYRNVYLYVLVALYLINFIVKNLWGMPAGGAL